MDEWFYTHTSFIVTQVSTCIVINKWMDGWMNNLNTHMILTHILQLWHNNQHVIIPWMDEWMNEWMDGWMILHTFFQCDTKNQHVIVPWMDE